MEELEYKISQLVDNELSDLEQAELFDEFANNIEARESFREFLKIKKEIGSHYSGFNMNNVSIPQKFQPSNRRRSFIYKIGFYSSIAASIILAMMLLLSQTNNSILKIKYELLDANYKSLINTLDDFKNALNKKEFAKIKDETKPRVNLIAADVQKSKSQHIVLTKAREMLKELTPKLQFAQNKIVITQNDFIGGKVVAN